MSGSNDHREHTGTSSDADMSCLSHYKYLTPNGGQTMTKRPSSCGTLIVKRSKIVGARDTTLYPVRGISVHKTMHWGDSRGSL